MRGNVLNKKGIYNRCKLTFSSRQRVGGKVWAPRDVGEMDEECIRNETVRGKQKRLKMYLRNE